ncbi:serine protease Vpr [Lentibacillus halophilus]|uniref:Serine protease Vpr n=1 Tax=Lentibacillus halophilus TaxID=295065 RepID=A0ABN0Z7G1_9BACI
MRYVLLLFIAIIITLPMSAAARDDPSSRSVDNETSVIVEVKGSPKERQSYLQTHRPFIDIVAVYDKLFNGLALKAKPRQLKKLDNVDFITAVHQVTTYEAQAESTQQALKSPKNATNDSVKPAALNNTDYTGQGVQVAVVDTGIDYTHPDLADNFAGGYDLVDLDNDPMETTVKQGMPTMHGSHVAGIIAADGALQGVAPDAELHAYRALGSGGSGTSVQVIAALEQAVEDGADVINLSLGNAINGPDFPTSIAVNRAADRGVPVVVAGGNSGPGRWTIGSPATAADGLSVGAAAYPKTKPFLEGKRFNKTISLQHMDGSPAWRLTKDYAIESPEAGDVRGKIALVKRGDDPFYKKAKKAEEAGAKAVLIYNHEAGSFRGKVHPSDDPVTIPVASISQSDGQWLVEKTTNDSLYVETRYQQTPKTMAPFSSRGPVTVNWDLKPGVSAPGTNILSTVPGGYRHLQGTSMAAPHVTGVMALMMEAHPDWDIGKLTGAVKTTAKRLTDTDGNPFAPVIQGAGEIQPKQAIRTETIINQPLLSFGKVTGFRAAQKQTITVTNTSSSKHTYSLSVPATKKGVNWHLPESFTLKPGESKPLTLELSLNSNMAKNGIHQGWLMLNQGDNQYDMPYVFVNKTADYPKAMGFTLSLKPFSKDTYAFQLYLTKPAKHMEVNLYSLDTLVHDRMLLESDNVQDGLNKGTLPADELGKPGDYRAVVTVTFKSGETSSFQTRLHIPYPSQ